MNEKALLIDNHYNYHDLIVYKKAKVIYHITYFFCHKFIKGHDRTVDQMVQAARSGKQNIVEGRADSETSSEMEIKLMNVAKGSLRELLEDYEDFLIKKGHKQWEKGSEQYEKMRELGREHNDLEFYMELIKTRPEETVANIAIILIKQTDYLLNRLIIRLGNDFVKNGGFKEKMSRVRREYRNYNKN